MQINIIKSILKQNPENLVMNEPIERLIPEAIFYDNALHLGTECRNSFSTDVK